MKTAQAKFGETMDQTEVRGYDDDLQLSDTLKVNGIGTTVCFTAGGRLRWSNHCLAVEKEVLGFAADDSKMKIRALIESKTEVCCGGGKGDFVRKSFSFEPLFEHQLPLWTQKLQQYIDSLGRPKTLFVFVNPYGGKKSASKIFVQDVKPMLEDANVEYTVQETKHRGHAKEIAQTLDLSKYDGIVCVSGDGILVEVVNGLLHRKDWKTAIRMPLGVVPAGTGNGMAKSLLDSVGEPCTPINAILSIIRGHKRSLDVATISQVGTRFFSVLMLAWGLIADIDIESERYRWLGNARIDLYAMKRIFSLRKYNGRIRFIPAPGYEAQGDAIVGDDDFSGEIVSKKNCPDEGPEKSQQYGYQGSDIDLKNLEWKKIEGPFVSIWLHNVPWGSEDAMAAPDAKFSDGYLDLIMIKDCPRLSLLSLMTKMNNGGHVKSPYVTYLKVKAFILEPGRQSNDPDKEGIIDVDGEVLARGIGTYKFGEKQLMAYDKLRISVDQGLATLFSPI